MNHESGIMNKMFNFRKIFWLVLFSILPTSYFLLPVANAAEFYFQSEQKEVGVGGTFRVDLLLDGREGINAVGGEISYPKNLLELKSVSDGGSIVSFWVQKPTLEKPVFAGIIPGGYALRDRKLLTLEFLAKTAGRGSIGVKSGQAFLNDGQGTAARLSISNYQFLISKESVESAEKIQDFYSPEKFVPQIASNPDIFYGKLFLTFATQDKGVGLSHYEVAEIPAVWWGLFRPKPDNWLKVEAPVELRDQELKSWVFVKAVDLAGNERVEFLSPRAYQNVQSASTVGFGLVALMVLLKVIALFVLWRLKRKKKR